MHKSDRSGDDRLASLLAAVIEQLRTELRDDLRRDLQHELQAAAAWPEWMSIETAARYLDMPVHRIRKLIVRRAIPYIQEGPGCRIFFSRHQLDGWMRSWSN